MPAAQPLFALARATSDHLTRQRFATAAETALARAFADDLGAHASNSRPTSRSGAEPIVPALRFAPQLLAENHEALADLLAAARAAFGLVRWTPFYGEDAWSAPFLRHFACGEGIGPDGRLVNDKVMLGLFVLGPETFYPPHAHPAEEFYLVLTGNPAFQVGADTPFVPRAPGEVILHASEVSHAIRTGAQPTFAVYGWRGDLTAPSWYRDDMSDAQAPKRYPPIAKA